MGSVSKGGRRYGLLFTSEWFISQDLWMFPNILMFHPEAARAILEYRVQTLGGALKNAQNLGYQVMNRAWIPPHKPLPQGLPSAIQWPRESHTSFLSSTKDCPSGRAGLPPPRIKT